MFLSIYLSIIRMAHGPQKQILPTVFAPDHFSMMAEKQTPWPKQEDDVFYEGYTETIQNLLKKYGKQHNAFISRTEL